MKSIFTVKKLIDLLYLYLFTEPFISCALNTCRGTKRHTVGRNIPGNNGSRSYEGVVSYPDSREYY